MSSWQLVILDFDGVVLESVNCRDQAYHQLFHEHPIHVRDEILHFHQTHPGIDRKEKIERIFTSILNIEPTPKDIEKKVIEFGKIAYQLVIDCQKVSGLDQFLDLINPRPIYIVSAAREDEVRRIAQKRKLDHRFKNIFGSPQKKAKHIEHILKIENVSPEKTLFIGDKISDYNAAQIMDVSFIGRVPAEEINPFPDSIETIEDFNNIINE